MTVSSVKTGDLGISFALDNNYMEPIATTLVGSGGVNQITFNDIPQTYKHLQIRGVSSTTNSGALDFAIFQFNGDNGTNYSMHRLFADGSGVYSSAATSTTSIQSFCGGTTTFGPVVLDILDYRDTNKNKTTRSISGDENNGSGNEYIAMHSGCWRDTSAITSITITGFYGTFKQHSRFSLYGIKG